ncbi:MAG: transposase family protein [Planctomycetaceae bacterium]|nr:transposase family protein [Planctomycetaceae bacterium]
MTADAATAAAVVEQLLRLYDPPLVFKSDNGSAFIVESFKQLLESWNVVHLLSPPCLPRYNGAAEAGVGCLKIHT